MAITITATPARSAVGQRVSFKVTLSNEARAVRNAAIDFGDRRVQQLAAASTTVTHAYAAAGAYTVTGNRDRRGRLRRRGVYRRAGRPGAGHSGHRGRHTPADPVAGRRSLSVDVAPPRQRARRTRRGDKLRRRFQEIALGALRTQLIAHVYERDGTYVVAVRVLDIAGRRHTASIGVQVRPAPGIAVTITAPPAAGRCPRGRGARAAAPRRRRIRRRPAAAR